MSFHVHTHILSLLLHDLHTDSILSFKDVKEIFKNCIKLLKIVKIVRSFILKSLKKS
jgi:hypothetical protein